MAETRATMTTRTPQKSPVLELRQSTEYLHPMLWSALNSFCFCRRQFISWNLPQWSRFQPDFTLMFDFYCFTIHIYISVSLPSSGLLSLTPNRFRFHSAFTWLNHLLFIHLTYHHGLNLPFPVLHPFTISSVLSPCASTCVLLRG